MNYHKNRTDQPLDKFWMFQQELFSKPMKCTLGTTDQSITVWLFISVRLFQGILLNHNVSARVVRSNQSLVLQRVARHSAGRYSCSATNSEGETVSNQFLLRVKCKCNFLNFISILAFSVGLGSPSDIFRKAISSYWASSVNTKYLYY